MQVIAAIIIALIIYAYLDREAKEKKALSDKLMNIELEKQARIRIERNLRERGL